MTKQLRHAMIDLETRDTIPSSKIVSIGVTLFDPRYRMIGDASETLYMELDWKAQTNRTEGHGTPEWWDKQSEEVRKALKGTVSLEDALEELAFFLPKDCKVWGNGATFDISILEDAYRQLDLEIPWKFWNILDMRTIKYLFESSRSGLGNADGNPGVLHNALDDAIFQAKRVNKIWNKLLTIREKG